VPYTCTSDTTFTFQAGANPLETATISSNAQQILITIPGQSNTTWTLTSAPSFCSFNGQAVTNGSTVTAYQSNTAYQNQGQQCVSQTLTCTSGTLTGGNYQYSTCNLVTPELTPVTAAILVGFALLIGWQVRRITGNAA
jgi:hypothetical protein